VRRCANAVLDEVRDGAFTAKRSHPQKPPPSDCKQSLQTLSGSHNSTADEGLNPVSHEKRIVQCSGPHEPHALHGIPLQPRSGDLDLQCPTCAGHGQWNSEIDLVSQRSKRHVCGKCDGRGWIETGDDMVSSHDIVMSPEGYPQWVTRLDVSDDRD
jgi:hypothetical protein